MDSVCTIVQEAATLSTPRPIAATARLPELASATSRWPTPPRLATLANTTIALLTAPVGSCRVACVAVRSASIPNTTIQVQPTYTAAAVIQPASTYPHRTVAPTASATATPTITATISRT